MPTGPFCGSADGADLLDCARLDYPFRREMARCVLQRTAV